MKTLFIVLALFFTTRSLLAQSEQYQAAMTDGITSLSHTGEKTPLATMLALANQFERIAGAEPKEWLPLYYAGLTYNYLGYMGTTATDKDRFLDKAYDYARKAGQLSPKNDELYVLNAQIAQARLVVAPMNRWQEYGPLFTQELEKAQALNANNPRIYTLQGSSLLYTPEQFGGGTATACPLLTKAAEKFATFKPASALHPNWGQANVTRLLTQCPK